MRKRFFLILTGALSLSMLAACGKGECKKYAAKFCADEKSPACTQGREKIKDWSADKCRIESNELQIEEQSKHLENELK